MAAADADTNRAIAALFGVLDGQATPSNEESADALRKLKVLGRQPQNAGAIYDRRGIETLARYGIDRVAGVEASREALACLANATLLKPSTRQAIVDLGKAGALAGLYSDSRDIHDEFLCGRLLLMLTAETTLDYNPLITEHGLADGVNRAVERHAEKEHATTQAAAMPTPAMALAETLKLLYSLLTYYPAQAPLFRASTTPLLHMLAQERLDPDKPDASAVSHVVNALFKFETSALDRSVLFPDDEASPVCESLLDNLAMTLQAYPEKQLDMYASPILGLAGELFAIAPAPVRASIKRQLLPSDADRTKPLGQGDSLSSKLLRLSSSGLTPELRKGIPTVLFELSDRDAATFVKNVGFGYASGFLNNNAIPAPPLTALEEQSGGSGGQINYVTGQYLADEARSTQPPMTEDEKEREAERLFVLFERLKATGVMDVKNPVQEAVQSGRFEELE